MTFNPLIPAATDLLSQSQSDLQTNFNQLNVVMGVDHVNFDNSLPAGSVAGDRGKHVTILSKRALFAAALPATGADEAALYTKESSAGGSVELYYRYPSSGTAIRLTNGPYGIKAWITADINPNTGAVVGILDSLNITNIVFNGGERWTITFPATIMTASNTNYCIQTNCLSAGVVPILMYVTAQGAGTLTIARHKTTTVGQQYPNRIYVALIGS